MILDMSFAGMRAAEVVAVHRHFDREAGMIVANKTDARTAALPPFIHQILLKLPKGISDLPRRDRVTGLRQWRAADRNENSLKRHQRPSAAADE